MTHNDTYNTMSTLEHHLRQQASQIQVQSDRNIVKRVKNQIKQQSSSQQTASTPHLHRGIAFGVFAGTTVAAVAVFTLLTIVDSKPPPSMSPTITTLASTLEGELDLQVDQLVAQREASLQNEWASIEADAQKIGSVFGLKSAAFLK